MEDYQVIKKEELKEIKVHTFDKKMFNYYFMKSVIYLRSLVYA